MTADPKTTRHRATRAEWRRILAEKVAGEPCRCCGARAVPTSGHHLLGGNRREDLPELVVPLCGSGTTGCHGVYTSRWPGMGADGKRREWDEVAAAVRASLREDEIEAVVARVGDVGLERLYPRRRERPRARVVHDRREEGGDDAA